MKITIVLGPAGSGKTFRCLAEIRQALAASPEGRPLVLLAPKQATFQLERQLLADSSLAGYTRLHILSFERLADFILAADHNPRGGLLAEEGRLMVLRALLAQKGGMLRLFHASARLPGFAQQLSAVLREFQHHRHSTQEIISFSNRLSQDDPLGCKLNDLAVMMTAYQEWLSDKNLQDSECLLDQAAEFLRNAERGFTGETTPITQGQIEGAKPLGPAALRSTVSNYRIGGVWLDGFAQMTPQELELLAALAPWTEQLTLAFCVDHEPAEKSSWLSMWSVVGQTFRQCYNRLAALPDNCIQVEVLSRNPGKSRFSESRVLRDLEDNWANSWAAPGNNRANREGIVTRDSSTAKESLRVAVCANPEAEAVLAAHEVQRFVRAGGRYRDCGVIVRRLQGYYDGLRRTFSRYGIPCFLDRREPVVHHPLAELTRYALRTLIYHWEAEDWFGVLKTGLAPISEADIDQLENEALARGWKGAVWLRPISIPDNPGLTALAERLRLAVVPPFQRLGEALGWNGESSASQPSGAQLAGALRALWHALGVDQILQAWSEAGLAAGNQQALAAQKPAAIHATIWQQMHDWLDNLALAFGDTRLALRDWLPILEAGLAGLSVGVIPPALDQVLVGTVDRSRNPDLKLAIVLGLNEGIFPAVPAMSGLLTESERNQLTNQGFTLGLEHRAQLGQERYYGYIACTRARQRLVLACSAADEDDQPLNPSPFIAHVKRLFPELSVENYRVPLPWPESEHPCELIAPFMRMAKNEAQPDGEAEARTSRAGFTPAESDAPAPGLVLKGLPALAPFWEHWQQLACFAPSDRLSPAIAEELYGRDLRLSVTRLEEFAACPFKFFVSAGLKAEERRLFELDTRVQGSFQHWVLAEFHRQLKAANKRWRDISPSEARKRIAAVAAEAPQKFPEGLLQGGPANAFVTRSLTRQLQDFIEVIIGWMPQYEFDPAEAELSFGGTDAQLPAWEVDLGEGHKLAITGKIDRVDLWVDRAENLAWCLVVDFKASARRLEALLMKHSIQLQLPVYLAVLRAAAHPQEVFGVERLLPAGMFYASLRGQYRTGNHRAEVLDGLAEARWQAYQHTGRYDASVLRKLDNRSEAKKGTQFKYMLNKDGTRAKSVSDPMDSDEFMSLLEAVPEQVNQIGRAIFAGNTSVNPYQKGQDRPCDRCSYSALCRIDPWTHVYRVLR